ncbi:MAG: hypothetical protein V1875_04440 [Candidatus Altiarchaeota archaeon]
MDEAELLKRLNERYGSLYSPQGRLIPRREKIFLYSGPEVVLKYGWCGLHIANMDLSLTIEGAQLLGATASKNLVAITPEQAKEYYLGRDLPGFEGDGYVILRTAHRIVGPGLLGGGLIKNTLPDSRKTKL